ncbi:hypothetical protein SAMN05661099_1601 [Daejeonella lutea]|uniref:Uncharacterized protein n=1 Tax=Daejeonella lutea TaxID=572036 RepID=A0A1T5BKY1_9SPHI|nr:hypothetical protein SAMN05661099_1601 [Daejeonella lutea]
MVRPDISPIKLELLEHRKYIQFQRRNEYRAAVQNSLYPYSNEIETSDNDDKSKKASQ